MLISRRRALIAGAAFFGAPRSQAEELSAPPAGSLAFRVMRGGSEIGKHSLTFVREAGRLTVHVAVDLSVGIGPITLFRYTHRATEIWQDGQFVSVEAKTDNDGKPCYAMAHRTEVGLIVEGTKAPRYTAPDDALPATHWNRKMLNGPMINTQYGDLMRPTVTMLGEELVPAASGSEIRAHHFELSGDAILDTWYDEKSNWAALTFKASDKSEIRYERI